MKPNALIDLFVPVHAGAPSDLVAAAARAGLDAIFLVADSPDELPPPEELDALRSDSGPAVHAACVVRGVGFRSLILLDPDALEDANLDAIEAANDPALVYAAARELGGCSISICPRQGREGEVHRSVAPLSAKPPIGVVALVANGSRLGRDLDVEDAGVDGRRVLAATGPFGTTDDVGRWATLIPADPSDLDDIIAKLIRGFGIGVELVAKDHKKGGRKGKGKGRGKDTDGADKRSAGGGKRRRRRRGRGKGKGQGQSSS